MFTTAACCPVGLKPLLLRPLLSPAVDSCRYVTTVSCLSGIPKAFNKKMQKAYAKTCSREATQTATTAELIMAQDKAQEFQEGIQTATTTKVIMAHDKVQEVKLGNDIHQVVSTEPADEKEKPKAVKISKAEEIIVRSMEKEIQNQAAHIEALKAEFISLKSKCQNVQVNHSKLSRSMPLPENVQMQGGMATIEVLSDALPHEVDDDPYLQFLICIKLGDLDELLLELSKQRATALDMIADFSVLSTIVDDTSYDVLTYVRAHPEASLLDIRRKMKKQIRELAAQIDVFEKDLAVLKSMQTKALKTVADIRATLFNLGRGYPARACARAKYFKHTEDYFKSRARIVY